MRGDGGVEPHAQNSWEGWAKVQTTYPWLGTLSSIIMFVVNIILWGIILVALWKIAWKVINAFRSCTRCGRPWNTCRRDPCCDICGHERSMCTCICTRCGRPWNTCRRDPCCDICGHERSMCTCICTRCGRPWNTCQGMCTPHDDVSSGGAIIDNYEFQRRMRQYNRLTTADVDSVRPPSLLAMLLGGWPKW
jgi:hypothetical protein